MTTEMPPKTIKLKMDRFAKVAAAYGWTTNADIARALGIDETTVGRVLKGKANPGVQFIGGLLAAAEEIGFRRVFEVVDLAPENAQTS